MASGSRYGTLADIFTPPPCIGAHLCSRLLHDLLCHRLLRLGREVGIANHTRSSRRHRSSVRYESGSPIASCFGGAGHRRRTLQQTDYRTSPPSSGILHSLRGGWFSQAARSVLPHQPRGCLSRYDHGSAGCPARLVTAGTSPLTYLILVAAIDFSPCLYRCVISRNEDLS